MMKKILAWPILLIALLFAMPSFAATCKISEYTDLVVDKAGRTVPVASEPAKTTQSVTYTTSTASAAFNASTKFIRVICDAKAHFSISGSPTATASSPYLAADSAEYFGVRRGLKISFYDGSS